LILKLDVALTNMIISRSMKIMTSRSVGDIGSWPKRKAFKVSDQK
jgi:hypothetical protein